MPQSRSHSRASALTKDYILFKLLEKVEHRSFHVPVVVNVIKREMAAQ